MVPLNTEAANLERRERWQVGSMWSGMRNAFRGEAGQCGIYEWQARREDQPNRVVYVGSTCRGKPEALRDRILEYCTNGSHKARLINLALRRGYELRVRVKGAGGYSSRFEEEAEDMENDLLAKYNYAWKERMNGGTKGKRDILPRE